LKVPRTLRFLVVLRIQPHFHPMPKGNGLSCSGKAVKIIQRFTPPKYRITYYAFSLVNKRGV
ncbi:hypothetical protein ACTHS9_14650, partial [Bacillus mycoides]|uniref:hypothetical protein n=1 Tax=Bacillus mycoides TaxID=1405 RepID=UPI003F7C917F